MALTIIVRGKYETTSTSDVTVATTTEWVDRSTPEPLPGWPADDVKEELPEETRRPVGRLVFPVRHTPLSQKGRGRVLRRGPRGPGVFLC